MQRRKLLRSIGAGTAMAVGASASATAMKTPSAGDGITHLSVDDGGTRRLIPLGILKDGIHSVDVGVTNECVVDCCENCPCTNCLCGDCGGDGGGGGC